jgi:hypothetical protein
MAEYWDNPHIPTNTILKRLQIRIQVNDARKSEILVLRVLNIQL